MSFPFIANTPNTESGSGLAEEMNAHKYHALPALWESRSDLEKNVVGLDNESDRMKTSRAQGKPGLSQRRFKCVHSDVPRIKLFTCQSVLLIR